MSNLLKLLINNVMAPSLVATKHNQRHFFCSRPLLRVHATVVTRGAPVKNDH